MRQHLNQVDGILAGIGIRVRHPSILAYLSFGDMLIVVQQQSMNMQCAKMKKEMSI